MPVVKFRFLRDAAFLIFALAFCIHSQTVTTIKVINSSSALKASSDLTFGMVFKAGDIPAGKTVSTPTEKLQVDAKAYHADGSLRHAVLSLHLANLAASEARSVPLTLAATPTATAPILAADVLKTDFDAIVTLTIAGVEYTASAREALASSQIKTWLSGTQCTEWLVSMPLKNFAGLVQPQLMVHFAIRAYQGLKNIRADITVENNWTFEPNPMGLTYDAKISIGKDGVKYSKAAIPHTHHTRWRRVLWWGEDPSTDYQFDIVYLLSTGAFPFYDRSVKVASTALANLKADYDPMSAGDLTPYMPETGAHSDIGPLPSFGALYLLSMDARARLNVLANGNCGGSYQIHYRQKATDLPVTIDDFPYMTLLGNPGDTKNPKTGLSEAFPAIVNGLEKLTPDDAHQPSIAFLPYVISGDYFYLEELQFWANYNMILANPGYRFADKGILKWGQIRAQAWSMRTLAQAAYITPDNHPLKNYFNNKLLNNVDWYNIRYTGDPNTTPPGQPLGTPGPNTMGFLEGQYGYPPCGIAPWMDDFFTWTMGYILQLGYWQVKPLLFWKSKFVIGRFNTPGYCWLKASEYTVQVGTADKVLYKNFAEIFNANYPGFVCTGTAMDGYPTDATGYGGNMQPALAAAVDAKAPGAKEAWDKYQTRDPKQDYTSQPQFAVIPGYVHSIGIRSYSLKKNVPIHTDWVLPGTPIYFNLSAIAEVNFEVMDSSGRKLVSSSLGKLKIGLHKLDWEKLLPNHGTKNFHPYFIQIKSMDASKQLHQVAF